jgi:hypothetical protein
MHCFDRRTYACYLNYCTVVCIHFGNLNLVRKNHKNILFKSSIFWIFPRFLLFVSFLYGFRFIRTWFFFSLLFVLFIRLNLNFYLILMLQLFLFLILLKGFKQRWLSLDFHSFNILFNLFFFNNDQFLIRYTQLMNGLLQYLWWMINLQFLELTVLV